MIITKYKYKTIFKNQKKNTIIQSTDSEKQKETKIVD